MIANQKDETAMLDKVSHIKNRFALSILIPLQTKYERLKIFSKRNLIFDTNT